MLIQNKKLTNISEHLSLKMIVLGRVLLKMKKAKHLPIFPESNIIYQKELSIVC